MTSPVGTGEGDQGTPDAKGGGSASSSTASKSDSTSGNRSKADQRKEGKATSTKRYRVLRVVDGDTVEIDMHGGETVRIIGIDSPETVHPDEPVECGGPEASAAAKTLLNGKRVAVVPDASQEKRDKYGRLLAYLDVAGTGDFGEDMLRAGHAKEYTYDQPYKRRPAYLAAEEQARHAERGVWGSCQRQPAPPAHTPPPPPPAPSSASALAPVPVPAPAPAPPLAPAAPGPGWTNDALTPSYTGCRQGYPGGRINGVYWWKPIPC